MGRIIAYPSQKCYSHPAMMWPKKTLVIIGILAGLFLLWLRLGGIAGIAEIALTSAVKIQGTSPYAARQILTNTLGIDSPARYLLLFHSNTNNRYAVIHLWHGIPSIEEQNFLVSASTTLKTGPVMATVTFTPQAVETLRITLSEPISLSHILPTSRQNLKNINVLLDDHSVFLSSSDERLQKIFEMQGWTAPSSTKK